MALPTHVLLMYGYLLLFAWVLVEQFGIPLPATPVLLAAGALSAEDQISFPLALLVGVAASLTADSCMVPRRPPLRAPRAAHSLQAVAGANDLRPQDAGLLWPPPRRHADDCQVRARPGNAGSAGGRRERHGLRRRFCSSTASALRSGWARCWPSGRFFGDAAQARPQPAQLGWPLLRCAADSGRRWLLCGPRSPPSHDSSRSSLPRVSILRS